MDLIGQLASTLGVDTAKAESAAGAILGTVQQYAPAGALDGLMKSAPEASGWLAKAAPLLGGASSSTSPLGALGGLFGGGGGGALGGLGGLVQGAAAIQTVTSVVEKLGVPPELAAKAVPLVLAFVQSKLGDGGFQQLAAQVPFLKELGSASSEGGGLGGLGDLVGGFLK